LKHLDTGKHRYRLERETVIEFMQRNYVPSLQKAHITVLEASCAEAIAPSDDEQDILPGWALKTAKRSGQFSPEVRKYLNKKFMVGEVTGRKLDAGRLAKDMQNEMEGNNPMFTKRQFLTTQQIAGFWSRLTKRYKEKMTEAEQNQFAIEARAGEAEAGPDEVNNDAYLEEAEFPSEFDLLHEDITVDNL
jgi:hypothetical protein